MVMERSRCRGGGAD